MVTRMGDAKGEVQAQLELSGDGDSGDEMGLHGRAVGDGDCMCC